MNFSCSSLFKIWQLMLSDCRIHHGGTHLPSSSDWCTFVLLMWDRDYGMRIRDDLRKLSLLYRLYLDVNMILSFFQFSIFNSETIVSYMTEVYIIRRILCVLEAFPNIEQISLGFDSHHISHIYWERWKFLTDECMSFLLSCLQWHPLTPRIQNVAYILIGRSYGFNIVVKIYNFRSQIPRFMLNPQEKRFVHVQRITFIGES